MARKRTTIDRDTLVSAANRMIAHLSESGTDEDRTKREAIIAVTSQTLLDAITYKGYSYLHLPMLTTLESGDVVKVYDESRVRFN